jgi:hypothetical protein
VSDVRLTGVTTKGVNLEVMILEELRVADALPFESIPPPVPQSWAEQAAHEP